MSGGYRGSDRKARLPSNWRVIRAKVLARDPICKICNVRPSTHCDHIEAKTDAHAEDRLQGLCGPCHDQKSSREGNDAQRANPRPGRTRPPEQHPGLL
ncbi:HNH endonuclease signature motif containing protein [Streptomyces sp. NPDC006640]|uniref:HNH endonuclease signature motif containing protein n=1 Tax=Streptomyces sp. NPDC006640 TaxID=3364754 RepID=UPI0036B91645